MRSPAPCWRATRSSRSRTARRLRSTQAWRASSSPAARGGMPRFWRPSRRPVRLWSSPVDATSATKGLAACRSEARPIVVVVESQTERGERQMPVDPLRWKALAIVCAAFFMTILDVSIVNVALPSIGKSLHFTRDNLQWVITAYAITFGGFLLLAGRLADLLGRRRVFLVGVVLFTTASLICGLAWSEGVLIASRAVQGLGAAVITPSALSIVMTTFEEGAERNKALGIWGALGGGGAAVGVLAGGVLTKYLGWEWIFFVNVPVGAIALLLTPRFVRESRVERETTQDVGGAITVTVGLALLVYAVSKAPDHGWSSGWTLSRIAIAVVLLAVFLAI